MNDKAITESFEATVTSEDPSSAPTGTIPADAGGPSTSLVTTEPVVSAFHDDPEPPRPQRPAPLRALAVPSDDQLRKLARSIAKTETNPLDVLRSALAYHLAEPTAFAIRSRDVVMELLRQASVGVSVITALASHVGVRHDDGSRVEPSDDHTVWSHAHLVWLGSQITAAVSRAMDRADNCESRARVAENAEASMREQLEKSRLRVQELTTQMATIVQDRQTVALRANTLLCSYVDQDDYVVAMVDPATGNPTRFLRLEEKPDGTMATKPVTQLIRATKFQDWESANTHRARLQRSRREAGKSGRLGVVSEASEPSLVVMQLSLRPITPEDLTERDDV